MPCSKKFGEVDLTLDSRAMIGEAPTWSSKELALFWIDIEEPALHRFDPATGCDRKWEAPSEIGAIALCPDGDVLLALRMGLVQLSLEKGGCQWLAPPPFNPFTHRFNDGGCDARGRFWIGAMSNRLQGATFAKEGAAQAIYCYSPEEGLKDGNASASLGNGIVWSPDSSRMYYTDTEAGEIRIFDFDAESGRLSAPRLFRRFYPAEGKPDGAAVDLNGCYWCALYGSGRVVCLEALMKRAEEAGCEALVITTDAQFYGDREWERRRFTTPGVLTLSSVLEAALHPHWLVTTLLRQGMPRFVNILDFLPKERRRLFPSAFWVRANMDRALDWEELARIRKLWPRRLLIKGILDLRDVARAARIGVDGVILSNHGGRQMDWTIAGLDSLQQARQLVGEKLTLIVDGGMRRGTDVLKALALGADAVLIGRAALYGLCAAGSPGVMRAIEIFREELVRDLGLLGAPSIRDLGPDFLTRC